MKSGKICIRQADLMEALQNRGMLKNEIDDRQGDAKETSSASDISLSDKEVNTSSNTLPEENYHYAKSAKVLGVHKQERRKSVYFFVIIVRWSDKSNVTIYREWKEIKQLQSELLRVAKNSENVSDSLRYLKKTGQRVRKFARFHQGTMQRLNMIDSLNQYLEAVLHFKHLAESILSRKFFKPNERDITSMTWSGDGRTYFYVTRDILGERNKGFGEENEQEIQDEDDGFFNAGNIIGSYDPENIDNALSDAMEKHYEADTNISWPINSTIHVAICDYEAPVDDQQKNIIKLKRGEEVDVLDRNECGWWLVSRTVECEKGKTECGYVPASYLERKDSGVQERVDSLFCPSPINEGDTTDEPCSAFSDGGFDSAYGESNESSPTEESFSVLDEPIQGNPQPWSCVEDTQQLSEATSGPGTPKSFEDSNRTNEAFDPDHSSTASSSSLQSLEYLSSTPKSLLRRRTLGVIDCMPTATGSLTSLGPRTDNHTANPRLQMKSVMMRRLTCGALPAHVLSSPDLTNNVSLSADNSPTVSRNSSLLSIARRGLDYISVKEYTAGNPDEISFEEGSIISVFRRNSNGWWLASYQGKTGLVPGVSLKRYKDPMRKLSLHVLDML